MHTKPFRNMAETSASRHSLSNLDDDFTCPVCKEIFQTPVRTLSCAHVFCRRCFLNAMKSSGVYCPLCRGPVSRKERSLPKRASDIEEKMRKLNGNCKSCERQVKYYMMRRHYKTCNKYQEEYGPSPEDSKVQICQDSAGCSNRTSTLDSTRDSSNCAAFPDNERTLPKYKCPLCSESNLCRRRLLEHCNNRHRFEIINVMCPICVSTPWGVPHHPISNLVQHLNVRHQFDYGEYVDFQLDEETQFQAAVEQSFNLSL
ncbi:E3 ubiquitin-protein ligase RNF138 [Ambystoma mexicanum]|uniref:E3 ubiquitin-protein ligase RNF138 n=1 Tax=Ambystoma mexicanum TaxID=8296 RepID=UPI0037E7B121